MSDSVSFLSKRASAVAKPSPGTLIWEVLRDQWHPESNPDGYVSVGVAENRLMHSELTDRIAKCPPMPESGLTYGDGPFGSHRIRKAMANFLTEKLRPVASLDKDDIIITNGVSHSIEHTSWAFLNPSEGFLLGRPHYGAFVPDIELRPDAHVVPVSFGNVDLISTEAVKLYESALLESRKNGIEVKALMLCSPHNPLGRCYSRPALLAYIALCAKYSIHLVSDEIYALSVWGDTSHGAEPFTSILSIDLAGLIDPNLVHVLWGVSKDFGANGLRLGCIITTNAAFKEAMNSVAIYSYASGLADHVVAELLEDQDWTDTYIQINHSRLRKSYDFTTNWLRKHNIQFTPGTNAAFFLWVDLGKVYAAKHPGRKSEGDVTDEIMQALLNQKLFLARGNVFGSERPGVFRIVFSHPVPYMEEALSRMLRAVEAGNKESKL